MFSGGDYEEVARWLRNFVTSHAKREDLRAEAVLEDDGPRYGQSYGVRVRHGDQMRPPATEPPVELGFAEVAAQRGSLAWCAALAERVRGLAREFAAARVGAGSSA